MYDSKINYLEQGEKEIIQKIGSQGVSKLAIMYSGGKDSTAVLISLSRLFPNAELMIFTCNNGHMYPEEIKNKVIQNVNIIRNAGLLKNTFSIAYIDLREALMDLGIRSLHDDVNTYPTCYICNACKLLMHAACAFSCNKNGCYKLCDGYNSKQKYYPEQVPPFHKMVSKAMQKEYKVETISPLYETLSEKNTVDHYLSGFGLNPDKFDKDKGGQASCSLGGAFKPPRLINGDIDESFYDIFEKGSIDYTKEKIKILFKKEQIIQHREVGLITKQSFPDQIADANFKSEIILNSND